MIPTVTEILRWAHFYDQYPQVEDSAAMRRGRLVHEACNILARPAQLDTDWVERHQECAGYIQAYLKFSARHRPRLIAPLADERLEVIGVGYRGHPDQILAIEDLAPIVVELKTGRATPSARLQVCAYARAWDGTQLRRAAVLELDDAESYNFEVIPVAEQYAINRDFSALVAAWHAAHRHQSS